MKKVVVSLILMMTVGRALADWPYNTNVLVNPSYEYRALTPWKQVGDAVTAISKDAHSGSQSLLLTAGADEGVFQRITGVTAADRFQAYRFLFWYKSVDPGLEAKVEGTVYELAANGSRLAVVNCSDPCPLAESWQLYTADILLSNVDTVMVDWCIYVRGQDSDISNTQILIDDAVLIKLGSGFMPLVAGTDELTVLVEPDQHWLADQSNSLGEIPPGSVPDGLDHASFLQAVCASVPPSGWTFYWNAPQGWSAGATGDLSKGAINDFSSWKPLLWSGTQWTCDGNDAVDNPPSDSLKLSASSSHPGAAGSTRCLDRHVIASYQADRAGDYQIGMAWMEDLDAVGNGLLVKVLHNETVIRTVEAAADEVTRFETRIENVSAGDRISVAVGPNQNSASDNFKMDFRIACATPHFDGMPVFNIADYGAAGDGVTDDIQAFIDAIAATREYGGGIIEFDGSKTYRIIGNPDIFQAAFYLNGIHNIKLNGHGAKILLHPPDRLADILDSSNIEINGFTVDYWPLPYFQADILSVDVAAKTLDIQVPTRYEVPDIAGSWPEFSHLFMPDASGSRSGSGVHLYVDSVTPLDSSGRYLRVHARGDMATEIQQAHDAAMEIIMPNRLYGQRGNYSLRIRRSSQIAARDVLFRCVPQFIVQVQDNNGPIMLSNVDILMKNPETELFVSWRDGFHIKENRFGVFIEGGKWDGASMYDDLFNMASHLGAVQSIPATNTYTLFLVGGDYHTWKAGDWVSVWDANQDTQRGMGRVISPASTVGMNFTITLDRTIGDIVPGDIFVNEELLNRDTLIRYCETTNIGAGESTSRLRTPALFHDNTFNDSYWWLCSDAVWEGPRPREIIFRNCRLQGQAPWGLVRLVHVLSAVFESCTMDGHYFMCKSRTENLTLKFNNWVQIADKAIQMDHSGPLYAWKNRVFDMSGQEVDFMSRVLFTGGSTPADVVDLTQSIRQSYDLNKDSKISLPDLGCMASEWECHYTLEDLVMFAYFWLDDWESTLIGRWMLDKTARTIVADSNRHVMAGMVMDGLSFSSNSEPAQVGRVLQFNGTDDCIDDYNLSDKEVLNLYNSQ